MYYILNETNQIIAADDNLLDLCDVNNINELFSTMIQQNTIFDILSDDTVKVTRGDDEKTYAITQTSLSSMLGHLTLVSLHTEEETVDTLPTDDFDLSIDETETDIIDSILHENIDNNVNETPNTLTLDDDKDEAITFGDHISNDDEMLVLEDTPSSSNNEISKTQDDDSELFDLVLGDSNDDDKVENLEAEKIDLADESAENLNLDDIELFGDKPMVDDDKKVEDLENLEISLTEELKEPMEDSNFADMKLFGDKPKTDDVIDIAIDVEYVSAKIGISSDDYNNFLNDFINTALNLEKELQSSDTEVQSEAIGTLTHLSDVLHLPVVGGIIDNIANTSDSEQREVIESFYSALSRITTSGTVTEPDELGIEEEILHEETIIEEAIIEEAIIEETPLIIEDTEEEKLELFNEPTIAEEPVVEKKTLSSKSFGTISLEGIKPKHFDFQLEEAANDLSLPVELIEEFVHDFIEQSHIETKKMLEAYEDGDFDTIKKIGHLLKGASSNLRINALSDTLYKIQFCEDTSTLEPLIKDYWAHFLSFENQINVISN